MSSDKFSLPKYNNGTKPKTGQTPTDRKDNKTTLGAKVKSLKEINKASHLVAVLFGKSFYAKLLEFSGAITPFK